jgi:hypothetical protein
MPAYTLRSCPDCNGTGKGKPLPASSTSSVQVFHPCELCMGGGQVGIVPWPKWLNGTGSMTFIEKKGPADAR